MTLQFVYVAFVLPAIALLMAYGGLKLTQADGRRAQRMIDEERAREAARAQPSA